MSFVSRLEDIFLLINSLILLTVCKCAKVMLLCLVCPLRNAIDQEILES